MELLAKDSIRYRKLKFNRGFLDLLNDLLFPILIGMISLFLAVQLIINFADYKVILKFSILLFISLSLLTYIIKNLTKIDQLAEIETKHSEHINKELTLKVAKILGWSLLEEQKDYLLFRNPSRIINLGERIAVFYENNVILINSTAYPINQIHSRYPISFRANKRNLKKFKEAINKIYI